MGRLQVVNRRKPPFEHVVRVHGTTVFRVCCAVVGLDEADDAWSNTFLSALQAYPDLDPEANVEAWLVTIAHRRSIDILRARDRRPAPVDGPTPDIVARTDSSGELATGLAAALSGLPDKQRQSIAYHFLAGLPYREVAEIVGGSAEAARRAASDGIRRLRSIQPTILTLEEDQ